MLLRLCHIFITLFFFFPAIALAEQVFEGASLEEVLAEEIALKTDAELVKIHYLRLENRADISQIEGFSLQSVHIDPRIRKFTAEVKINLQDVQEEIETVAEGRYEIHQYIPVPARNISRGQVIRARDITELAYPTRKIRGDIALYIEDVEGKEASRNLRMHQKISKSNLITPIVIRKGQVINATYLSKNMVINIEAEALRDGGINEVIEFKNLSSDKIFSAKIFDATNVIINYQTNSPLYEAEKIMRKLPQSLE